jgi:hypothetical protein
MNLALKKFKVFVKGENYLLRETENPPRKCGFYTTVFVEAINAKQAEAVAAEILRNDLRLRETSENEVSDPPVIEIESVEEIQTFEGCNLPRTGLALFEEGT